MKDQLSPNDEDEKQKQREKTTYVFSRTLKSIWLMAPD